MNTSNKKDCNNICENSAEKRTTLPLKITSANGVDDVTYHVDEHCSEQYAHRLKFEKMSTSKYNY